MGRTAPAVERWIELPKNTFLNLPADKRQRIIDEALAEFAAHPYRLASLSRICQQAGIAKGSMYQYFADKFDLYMYLMNLTGQLKLQYIKKELDTLPEAADLFALLLAAAQGGLKMARDHPQLQRLGDRLLHESDEFLAQVMAGFGGVGDATMESWIQDAHKRGTLDRRVRPRLAAYILQTLFMGMGRDMAAGRIPRDDVLPMLREVLDIIEHGMRRRPRPADVDNEEVNLG